MVMTLLTSTVDYTCNRSGANVTIYINIHSTFHTHNLTNYSSFKNPATLLFRLQNNQSSFSVCTDLFRTEFHFGYEKRLSKVSQYILQFRFTFKLFH